MRANEICLFTNTFILSVSLVIDFHYVNCIIERDEHIDFIVHQVLHRPTRECIAELAN